MSWPAYRGFSTGTGGGHVIEDEGTPLAQRDNLNFTGAGVTATDAGGKTVVTIPDATLTAAQVDALTAATDTVAIVVPGTQSGNLRKATLRPNNQFATYADLLAATGMIAGDKAWTPVGAIGNLLPVEWLYDGSLWHPVSPVEWSYVGSHASPVSTPRTTVGDFALAAGGSTSFCAFPANFLRQQSVFSGELIVRRTGTTTAGCSVQVKFGTSLGLVINGDTMTGTATTELRSIFSFGVAGATTLYSSNAAGIGSNQPLCNEFTDAQVNLAAAMALGVRLNTADTDSTFAVQYLRVSLRR